MALPSYSQWTALNAGTSKDISGIFFVTENEGWIAGKKAGIYFIFKQQGHNTWKYFLPLYSSYFLRFLPWHKRRWLPPTFSKKKYKRPVKSGTARFAPLRPLLSISNEANTKTCLPLPLYFYDTPIIGEAISSLHIPFPSN